MFFLMLTFTFILGVTGGYLLFANHTLLGTFFVVGCVVSLIFIIAYYASKRKNRSSKWECLDCAMPDCDVMDCGPDCKPDCDCGGPNCD